MVLYMQMDVYSFVVRNINVDMTFRKGYLAYVFEKDGKSYGKKMKVPGRAVMDLVSVLTLFIVDIYDTIEALEK